MRTYFKMLLFVRTHQDKSPRCSTTRLFITSIHHQINEIKIFPFASIQRTFFKHKIVQKPIPKLQTQFSIWYLGDLRTLTLHSRKEKKNLFKRINQISNCFQCANEVIKFVTINFLFSSKNQ